MKTKSLLSLICAAILLAGCGEAVEVPPAAVGRILTANGYQPESIPPSKFRLAACMAYCDKLVVVQTSDSAGKENFKLFMPKDQLNMTADLRFTFSIDPQHADAILARVTPGAAVGEGHHNYVAALNVYQIYGQPRVREVVRTVLAEYTINQVASSRETINAELFAALKKALTGTPIRLQRAALADVQFPEVITQAQELAAKRREAPRRDSRGRSQGQAQTRGA